MGVKSKNATLKKPQMSLKERRAEKRARVAEVQSAVYRRKRDRA
ncbi:hypothetical protein MCNF_20210 [Mycolicibacterium confluentis]|uniref:Uncharacterized protein n=2 Tax=Mycolicibacterium confluentis TaxID=28047 RepID=A0A7I7XVV6_9MYCO|nr:hypothetical protein MCNF_20210 [Mycolicibacterium confluentis]